MNVVAIREAKKTYLGRTLIGWYPSHLLLSKLSTPHENHVACKSPQLFFNNTTAKLPRTLYHPQLTPICAAESSTSIAQPTTTATVP